MATQTSDTLTGWLKTIFTVNRVEGQDVGSVTASKTYARAYDIADGAGPGQADLVFSDTRTIPANSVDALDLLSLTQQTFGVSVPYTFRQLRCVRVVNNETAAGRRILIGCDPGRPTVVYAAEVGPGSEWHSINQTDSWHVTETNSVMRIANPNSYSVSYTIFLLGTSTAA